MPVGCTALGKATLSHLDPALVEERFCHLTAFPVLTPSPSRTSTSSWKTSSAATPSTTRRTSPAGCAPRLPLEVGDPCEEPLQRASKDGWFTSVRSGRQTLWQLSPPFEQFLNGGEEKIYGFNAVQPDWDRRWLLVLARVAEDNRAGRHLLETRLSWAGFRNPAPGVWISTYTDRAKDAQEIRAPFAPPAERSERISS